MAETILLGDAMERIAAAPEFAEQLEMAEVGPCECGV